MSGEFCVLCGRTDVPVQDGLCPSCYAERHGLVSAPSRPTIVVCPARGARRVGSHWERRGRSPTLLGADDLYPLLALDPEATVRTVEWREESRPSNLRAVEGQVHLRFRGTERTEREAMTVKVEHRTCEECSRRSGHYFTATIQLRGPEGGRERPRARRERLWRAWEASLGEARADWRRAISWVEERPEGWDVFLTDTLAARSIARVVRARLSATLKESATLWGRRNGQDVYRVTFCLRFPEEPGETPRPARPSSD